MRSNHNMETGQTVIRLGTGDGFTVVDADGVVVLTVECRMDVAGGVSDDRLLHIEMPGRGELRIDAEEGVEIPYKHK